MKYSLFARVSITCVLCMLLCVSGFIADKSVAYPKVKHSRQALATQNAMNLQCDIGLDWLFYFFDLVPSVLAPDMPKGPPHLPHPEPPLGNDE